MKKSLPGFPLCTSFVLLIALFVLSALVAQAQLDQIENRIPKNIPLKVEFKNFKSETWVHDLEIIATNTGNKPIHFLFLSLTLDIKAEDGNVRGFALIFGNGDLYSTEAEAKASDPAIAPNASYTFKIKENSALGWDLEQAKENFVEPQKGFLGMGWISFGDGSGFRGGGSSFKKKTKLVLAL